MVEYPEARLDGTFSALADRTRRAILVRLAKQGDTPVSELARPFRMTLMGVTKHLRVLEEAGLVSTEKEGRVRRCRIEPAPLRTVSEWLHYYQGFWEEQIDSLENYFKTVAQEEHRWVKSAKKSRKPSSKSGARSARRGRESSKRGSTQK
jgi:DNA-binding transcriptional ArsR family regulator